MRSPDEVLVDLRTAWTAALPDRLLGLYVHGSLVTGDFAADRSDLDVLAVLAVEPDPGLLAELGVLHADLDRRHPDWAGRVEVEYVSLDAVRDAAARRARDHLIARISPGERLHLLPATSHRLVTWSTVHDLGRALSGPPPPELLPAVDPELTRAALLDHVRDWPAWLTDMTSTPGAQAYSVLTLCRALQRLRHGRQLSKRQAAAETIAGRPEWAGLVVWARDWWYDRGRDTDAGRPAEVRDFVTRLSADLLAGERG
ncbi:aminoglycoside adenylyltransferase domain-containing protein [Plantactinospora siamensis]|uniref:Aminoglycoside adenylyltransferase domain-containing protein n=1 Tax=Plantactinospora siamensis TaxID=555372 RepID=A0ABV6P4M8_9ACTN